jgi:hypothetical protein
VGTFERSYEVDGAELELYAQVDGDETIYELVDKRDGQTLGSFAEMPDDDTVATLVRARPSLADAA